MAKSIALSSEKEFVLARIDDLPSWVRNVFVVEKLVIWRRIVIIIRHILFYYYFIRKMIIFCERKYFTLPQFPVSCCY